MRYVYNICDYKRLYVCHVWSLLSRVYFCMLSAGWRKKVTLATKCTVLFLLSSGVALVNLWDVKSPTATAPRRRKRWRSAGSARELDIAPGKYVSSGCLLCYILARRMGGLLKRLVVTLSTAECLFFFSKAWKDRSLKDLHTRLYVVFFRFWTTN